MRDEMPEWEEWNSLTKEQRDYSLFKILADLYHRTCSRDNLCLSRLNRCETKFDMQDEDIKKLKDRKRFDTSVAGVSGLVGGALVWVAKWVAGK